MARPKINTTPSDFKAAIDASHTVSKEAVFVSDFYGKVVSAINSMTETVTLPDDDLSIAKANAALYDKGFEIVRISDQDIDGNCVYRIITHDLPE